MSLSSRIVVGAVIVISACAPARAVAGQSGASADAQPAQAPPSQPPAPTSPRDYVFDLGQIEVVGTADGTPGVGGTVVTRDQMWTFDRNSLDLAVNIAPGVVSTFDSNGRRNESDIFVRGFGRWQVPLMLDGVRIYLPADNRLDFSRFLTADIAAVQIQKGYASVLDGPGGMGGAINLVTRTPTAPFTFEATGWLGGRSADEGWNGYAMVGTRQEKYYATGSINYSDRDFWTLSGNYSPVAGSLQPAGERLSSDTADSRLNAKVGFTPNTTDEYTINFTKQTGEKGAPLNVYNNPPVPPNSFWRWPTWDITNTSFLTRTRLGATETLKGTLYYNTFENVLQAFDDATYTTQSANGRFDSPYDDHAFGGTLELGTTRWRAHAVKSLVYFRTDVHTEQQTNRPTHPTLSTTDPLQEQSQNTWSVALEDTYQVSATVNLVGGISYDSYRITKAQEYNTTVGLFEFPHGGADAFNWQGAAIWHYDQAGEVHASVSDRARFPVIFELYSTRFGTATPNPDLGPERATNLELGWKSTLPRNARLEAAIFYSDVRDLIQTVVLPDTTTQTQNVGNGNFYGVEFGGEMQVANPLRIGGNYTALSRTITDALQPNLRATGVPGNKAFLYASWLPISALTITPSLDLASDRWSDVNPAPDPAFPYVRTGAYTVLGLAAEYNFRDRAQFVLGFRNLTDDNYQLSWGFPQQGRTFYIKARVGS